MTKQTIYQNRIQEMKMITAGELSGNDGNWRIHPKFQLDAIEGGLQEIGIWDALIAYYSVRNEGKLTLVNGHGRKSINPDQVWPVLILDITDEEADTILSLHDSITSWAQIDPAKLSRLVEETRSTNQRVQDAIERIQHRIKGQVEIAQKLEVARAEGANSLRQKYEGLNQQSVKLVLNPLDVGVVEKAIRCTGKQNRSEAITAICEAYIQANGGKSDGK